MNENEKREQRGARSRSSTGWLLPKSHRAAILDGMAKEAGMQIRFSGANSIHMFIDQSAALIALYIAQQSAAKAKSGGR